MDNYGYFHKERIPSPEDPKTEMIQTYLSDMERIFWENKSSLERSMKVLSMTIESRCREKVPDYYI